MKVRINPVHNPISQEVKTYYAVFARRHWWNSWQYMGTCFNLVDAKALCNDILASTIVERDFNFRLVSGAIEESEDPKTVVA